MSRGRVISARAIAMRCRWPPENSCGYLVDVRGAQADRLERLDDAVAQAAACAAERREGLGHDPRHLLARVERSVRVLEHHLEVAPRPAQRVGRQRVQVLAQETHAPEAGRSSAITRRASVDFPEPDSPTMPRLRPACTRRAHAVERLHLGHRPEEALARQAVALHKAVDLEQGLAGLGAIAHGCASDASVRRQLARCSGPPTWTGGGSAPRHASITSPQRSGERAAVRAGRPARARCRGSSRAACLAPAPSLWPGAEQAARVRMRHAREHARGGTALDDGAAVHHQHAVDVLGDHAEVVGDRAAAPCRARPPGPRSGRGSGPGR